MVRIRRGRRVSVFLRRLGGGTDTEKSVMEWGDADFEVRYGLRSNYT
jgi:hypothetical protein